MGGKVFLFITLVVSVVINIHVFFEFSIRFLQTNTLQMHQFQSKNYSDYYKEEPIDDYKENFSSKSEFIILNVALYARMIFSDLAHVIVSTLINIVLFIFVKRKMELKRSLLRSNTVMNLIMMSKMKRIKILTNTTKPKDRISQMIVLNGI